MLGTAEMQYRELKEYIAAFKLKTKVKPLTFSDDVLKNIREVNKAKAKKERIKKAKEQKKIQAKLDLALNNFREYGKTIPYNFNKYIKGNICFINDTELVTNEQCRVPLGEVKKLLLLIKNGRDVSGERIGIYTVTSGTMDKIVIGCHTFLKDEIELVSKKLGM